eukprot:Hpha_TRINITY_DN16129_c0_g5::TRINITY_DN16129_c0_g5_i1::g.8347::m.8347/K12581/CNOT7_8, CAF1, POP2; CCR4-NOT transcription complex subunit 7/8
MARGMAQGPPPPPGPPGAGGLYQQAQSGGYTHYFHTPPSPFFPGGLQHAEGFCDPGMEHGGEMHEGEMHHGVAHNGYAIHDAAWTPGATLDPSSCIVDVWADGLEAAFEQIRQIVVHYPYVAMDTEFPGVVARPVGNFRSNAEFYYQTLRCNVNLLKIIQLGITFSDEEGRHPPGPCTWQFNFKFNLTDDIYAQDSIDLLQSSGIDFDRFASQGIEVNHFAELLISSGLVLQAYGVDTQVRWLSFHSGYDFGYLIKILTNKELPQDEDDFFELMEDFFPEVFDVKYLLKQTGGALSDMCGLTKLGEDLQVDRIGPAHQAGSDSLLTCHCFFKLAREFLSIGNVAKYVGVLYGLGQDKSEVTGGGRGGQGGEAFTPQGSRAAQQEHAQQQSQQQQQHVGNGWTGTPTFAPQANAFPSSPVAPNTLSGAHALQPHPGQGNQQHYIQHVVYRGTSTPTSVRNIQPGHHYDGIGGS